jgi:hypothetical protein
MLGMAGLVCFFCGSIGIGILTALWVLSRSQRLAPLLGIAEPIHLHQRAIFFYSLAAVLLGVQLMSMAFLAALVTATQRRDADAYSIVERAGREATWQMDTDGKGTASQTAAASIHLVDSQGPTTGRTVVE